MPLCLRQTNQHRRNIRIVELVNRTYAGLLLPPDSRHRRVHPIVGRHRNGFVASLGDGVEVQEGEGRRGLGRWREHAIGVEVSVHGALGEA